MIHSIFNDLIYQLKRGSFWIKFIILCSFAFLLLNILKSYSALIPGSNYSNLINLFALSSNLLHNLIHPWVWLSHMIMHISFSHFIWNMLLLYWTSQIVEDLIGKKNAIYIFFESAIMGALFFIASIKILPFYDPITEHYAYGASAAVMGLLVSAATISPNYNIRLVLFGNVALKYIAFVTLILDLLFLTQNDNSGGHAAHLGGAFMGWLYVTLLYKNIKLNFSSLGLKRKTKPKMSVIRTPQKNVSTSWGVGEERLNSLLDKIKKKGVESLSQEEKSFLDNYYNKHE